jgi:hypothetical protein
MPEPDCTTGSCRYDNFESGLPGGWKNLSQGSASNLQWEVQEGQGYNGSWALHGFSGSNDGGAPGQVARVQMAGFMISAENVEMSFAYRQLQADGGCDRGALQLWIEGMLVWQSCQPQTQWTLTTLSLAPWAGQVVRPELWVRADLAAGAPVEFWLDELRITGDCKAIDCTGSSDCADNNPCTDEVCLGFTCHYPTNQVPCYDGDACTQGDTCVGGQCESEILDCDDGESCTDDYCVSTFGCVFQPNVNPCDDGEPCTAGDTCSNGACFGNPILCKDFNDCTVDGCTPGVGCLFEAKAFAASCGDENAQYGMCWNGECVDWELKLSEVPGFAANDTRAYGVSTRQSPTPIWVAGSYSPLGKRVSAIFRIDQKDLGFNLANHNDNVESLNGVYGDVAVGENGSVLLTNMEADIPDLGVSEGIDLHAVASSGTTFFFGGDGSSVGLTQSTLRRCKRLGATWQTCHDMIVVRSPDQCEKQVPFHIRAIWVGSAQKLIVAGTSYENADDPVARIASWDGNTLSDCPGKGVYSGELYYAQDTAPLALAVNKKGLGTKEAFLALGGANGSSLWAGGSSGMIYHFDGSHWLMLNPSVWSATKGWNVHHVVRGIYATDSDVHLIGDGVGAKTVACRDSFYLHGRKVDGSWQFDRLLYFENGAADCGASPFTYAGLQDIAVDELTGDLYIVGWGPDSKSNPSKRRGLVLRLQKP